MYGLVNRAIHDMVLERHGAERWEEIRTRAGVETERFLSVETYPDRVSYDLVGAASEVLGAPPAEILRAFGRYWIPWSASHGHAAMLDMAGGDLPAFLANLDALHARIQLGFPNLDPPSFRVTDAEPGRLRLHYHSKRPGLVPFVVGILEGLGEHLEIALEVVVARTREDGHDHDELELRYGPR